METDYTEKDILRELNRRFYMYRYDDGTIYLRTKDDWIIYYVGNCNVVTLMAHDPGLSDVYKSFNRMLGKEMFYFTDLVNGNKKFF